MREDTERTRRARAALDAAGIAAVVCRLPENVLLLSGYWPMNGFALLVFPADHEPVLVAPDAESELAHDGWVRDVRTFPWGLVDSGDPFASIEQRLTQVAAELGLAGRPIGYEGSFEFVAAPYVSAEPSIVSRVTIGILERAFGPDLRDSTDLIHELRAQKTADEIAHLRVTQEIARLALQAFCDSVVPGNTEIAAAAAVESAVLVGGQGYKGVRAARAWASIMSGPRSASAYKPHLLSTHRRFAEGDMALLELVVVADGWWADLTRTRVAGRPRTEDLERWQTVVEAQQRACAAISPGVSAAAVDSAAREHIEQRGLGSLFIHHTGHGLGLRYHEPEPFLHPSVTAPLREGMVTTVEPGIYAPGWGGMRCEDNVLVTATGHEILSEFSRELAG